MTPTLTRPTHPPTVPQPAQPEVYRFSVEQYHRLGEAGILGSEERVELLDGIVVRKMTKHTPHTTAGRKASGAIQARLPAGWLIITQDPITLPTSEPEPDLVVVVGTVDDFATRHPGPSDIALVVEVVESSLPVDRGWKRRIYADARVPVYWIVNLVDRVVEVYTDPQGSGDAADYATAHTFRHGDAVPLAVVGVVLAAVPVADVLP
jgi:Uma2 family endonuclease